MEERQEIVDYDRTQENEWGSVVTIIELLGIWFSNTTAKALT